MKPSNLRPLWILLALGLAACGQQSSTSSTVSVEGDFRFPVEPVGLDTPAAGCVVCHSIEKGGPFRVAPNLFDIVDNQKARFRWYGYSPALASAGGEWTPEDLDAYLADPNGYLPGTFKTLIGIADPDERTELISFLATLQD